MIPTMTSTELARILEDFKILLTGDLPLPIRAAIDSGGELILNPEIWRTDYHSLSPYRPINYNLCKAMRQNRKNAGVFVNAVSWSWLRCVRYV
jgi:hypothetical protein